MPMQMPILKPASFDVPLLQQTRMAMVTYLQKKSPLLCLQRAQKAYGNRLSTGSLRQLSGLTWKARLVGQPETNTQTTRAIFLV